MASIEEGWFCAILALVKECVCKMDRNSSRRHTQAGWGLCQAASQHTTHQGHPDRAKSRRTMNRDAEWATHTTSGLCILPPHERCLQFGPPAADLRPALLPSASWNSQSHHFHPGLCHSTKRNTPGKLHKWSSPLTVTQDTMVKLKSKHLRLTTCCRFKREKV